MTATMLVSKSRSTRVYAGVAAAVAVAGALTACSSSKSGGAASGSSNSTGAAGTTAATSSCMRTARNFLKDWDTPPTKLSAVYTPLSKAPEAGKTFVKLVNGTIPSDNDSYNQLATAAKAVSWTPKKIVFNGTVEDLNQKFQQAVSQKPAAIGLSGWPVSAIQQPLEDAKKAGIVVSMDSISDIPSSYPGYAALSNGGPTSKQIGEINAYEFMRSSNCAGSAAIFNLPFPILKVATDSFTETVKANCPKCKVSYNEVQAKSIGTPAIANAVVSKLQSSPSTKYVYTIIGNVADGLDSALAQAGLNGIKIFGQVPDDASIAGLRNKVNAWWITQGAINGWTEFDAALRAIDTKATVTDKGDYPLAVLTPENVPSGKTVPIYPLDYVQEFKALWHVGS